MGNLLEVLVSTTTAVREASDISAAPAASVIADSRNALTDFDMCLALTELAINSQLGYAWKSWRRGDPSLPPEARERLGLFSDQIEIFKEHETDENSPLIDSEFGLRVVLAAPTVSFNVQDGKQGQVRMMLHLKSGQVVYAGKRDAQGNWPTYTFADWSVSFLVDLDRKPVDLKILELIDPDAARRTRGAIKNATKQPDINEDVFSIEYLFMKLTNVELLLAGNKDIQMPGAPSRARDQALSSLNLLLQGELSTFMLGTVVRRNDQGQAPTFALTDFIFDVQANPSAPEASTLSYLGEFSGRELPANRDLARSKFEDGWVRPERLDGREELIAGIMAIRKGRFLDDYLMPLFTSHLGHAPVAQGDARVFSMENSTRASYELGVDHIFESQVGYTLAITVKPGSNVLNLSGAISTSFTYREELLGTRWESAKLEAAGYLPLTGSITLLTRDTEQENADELDRDFAFGVDADLKFSFGSYVKTKEESSGFADVTEAFAGIGKWFDSSSKTPLELLSNNAQTSGENLKGRLQNALRQVDIDLSQHAFIPPGGGVFTFSNLRFSDQTADVIFDVIYKAP